MPAGISILIVEGVGAARRELADVVDACLWVQTDLGDLGQNLARVGAGELPLAVHEQWMAQEVPFLAEQRPWEQAHLIVPEHRCFRTTRRANWSSHRHRPGDRVAVTRTDALRNHWGPEAPDYLTWHLLFDDQPALHAVARKYHRAVAGIDGIDVVPTKWLHLTVQGVGAVDEITAPEVDDLVDAARERLAGTPTFDLTFRPAEVHWEGITLTATQVEPVSRVRTALRSAIATVRGPDRVPGADTEVLWPHISLAYVNAAVPAAALFDAIGVVRRESVVVKIEQATLIVLRRAGRRYVWSDVATAQLGIVDLGAPVVDR